MSSSLVYAHNYYVYFMLGLKSFYICFLIVYNKYGCILDVIIILIFLGRVLSAIFYHSFEHSISIISIRWPGQLSSFFCITSLFWNMHLMAVCIVFITLCMDMASIYFLIISRPWKLSYEISHECCIIFQLFSYLWVPCIFCLAFFI